MKRRERKTFSKKEKDRELKEGIQLKEKNRQ